jgi:hypothetical protein
MKRNKLALLEVNNSYVVFLVDGFAEHRVCDRALL